MGDEGALDEYPLLLVIVDEGTAWTSESSSEAMTLRFWRVYFSFYFIA